MCVFIDFAPVRFTAKLCNYATFTQKKAKLSRVVAATSKIFCGFLRRFSHDRALNTISHGMQKYPVDDYFKVPLASCSQSA